MSKRMYFVRKRNALPLLDRLIKQYALKVSFHDKNEVILKNENFLVACKKKYISVLLYDAENQSLASEIVLILSGK